MLAKIFSHKRHICNYLVLYEHFISKVDDVRTAFMLNSKDVSALTISESKAAYAMSSNSVVIYPRDLFSMLKWSSKFMAGKG